MTTALAIVADDLTGGCDAGTLFAGRGPVPLVIWPRSLPEAPVGVIDTQSRALVGPEAADRVRTAARAAVRRFFKKIDSTLRGRIGAETEALMSGRGSSTALCCPAFPAQGRVVIDGVLTVHGVPVNATPIAADRDFPRPAPSAPAGAATVDALLRPQFERPLARLSLEGVRAHPDALAEHLSRLTGQVVLADAETDADLEALAAAALQATPPPLLVGSAGLAGALARCLGLRADRARIPSGRRWLIVAGSRHPAARGQVAAARAAGLTVLVAPAAEQGDPTSVAKALAAQARAIVDDGAADLVVATGGETALAVVEAFGAERLDLVGAPGPGLALVHLRGPGRPALPMVTKAGGFGSEELFVSLAREAA
jgi:D-threonate/D-erythronate kinase